MIRTEFCELENLFSGGFKKGNLYILAGRPGTGYSTIPSEFAYHLAAKESQYVYYGTLEVSRNALIKCHGKPNDYLMIDDFEDYYLEHSIDMIDMDVLRSRISKFENKDIVILDWLQLFSLCDKNVGERADFYNAYTQKLKELAQSLDVAILIVVCLIRYEYQRKDMRPRLSDLEKTIGKFDTFIDGVIFTSCEAFFNHACDKAMYQGEKDVELIVAYNRQGKCGTVKTKRVYLD